MTRTIGKLPATTGWQPVLRRKISAAVGDRRYDSQSKLIIERLFKLSENQTSVHINVLAPESYQLT